MANAEIITDGGHRRRWSAAEKLQIVEERLEDHASISIVARRHGLAPNLLYRWRRLMLEGGRVAVTADDDVTSHRVVREMDSPDPRAGTPARAQAMEAENLREALNKSWVQKPTLLVRSQLKGDFQ